MNAVELISTEDLLQELGKRFQCLSMAGFMKPMNGRPDAQAFVWKCAGKSIECLGVCLILEDCIKQDMMHDAEAKARLEDL